MSTAQMCLLRLAQTERMANGVCPARSTQSNTRALYSVHVWRSGTPFADRVTTLQPRVNRPQQRYPTLLITRRSHCWKIEMLLQGFYGSKFFVSITKGLGRVEWSSKPNTVNIRYKKLRYKNIPDIFLPLRVIWEIC